jgi:hypothetical protein
MNFVLALSLLAVVSAQDAVDMVQHKTMTSIRTYSDMAIGVHTGGPDAGKAVDALKATVLRRIPKSMIMGDVADSERGIEEAPSRYTCSTRETLAARSSADGLDGAFDARGRCTQFRFAYLFLTLRERYPDAQWYIILDSDSWFDVDGTHEMVESFDNNLPWLMGIPPFDGKWLYLHTAVWGPLLIFNRALSERLDPSTLMGCTSFWNFASDVFDWPLPMKFMEQKCKGGDPECWKRGEAKTVFDECQRVLNATCGDEPATAFEACTRKMQEDPTNKRCKFEHVHPEYAMPMYLNLPMWDNDHGDDHFFSFCTLTAAGGTLIAQPRFLWRAPHLEFLKQGKTNEVCRTDALSYHKLKPEMIMELDEVKQSCAPNLELEPAWKDPGATYWERLWVKSNKSDEAYAEEQLENESSGEYTSSYRKGIFP